MNPLLLALLLSQTPNMDLPLVTPGSSLTATQNSFNQAMATIDGHNHSPGEGVLVPVGGLTIQTALPFNGYPALQMGYLGLVDAGAGPSVTLTLWNDGTNFWVEDGNGNKIQLTCSGGVCVTIGDGGSYSFTTITVTTSATVSGMQLASNCLKGPNGASYCFDNGPGDLVMTGVDGGVVYINGTTGSPIALIVNEGIEGTQFVSENPSGTNALSMNAGAYVGYDLLDNGSTSEQGQNLQTTTPDGGVFEVLTNAGVNAFQVKYDGGTILNVSKFGGLATGNASNEDGIFLSPGTSGSGLTAIEAVGVDPDIGIFISPRGDGGVILQGHIDTANSQGTTTVQWENPACLGDAGVALLANSNDTAGVIQITMNTTSSSCAIGTSLVGVNFANASFGTNTYSVQLTPACSSTGLSPALPPLGWYSASADQFLVQNQTAWTGETGSITYCIAYHVDGLGVGAH